MPRQSSISRMPAEVRDWIGRLFNQGRTLDEILNKLRELDLEAVPSRSALHRHLQRAEQIARQVRQTRTIAEVMTRQLGEGDDARLARGNIELMHSILMQVSTAAIDADDGGDGRIDLKPSEVMQLAKALDHLGKAAKDDVVRTVAIEKRAAEKARQVAAQVAADVARDRGLSVETAEAIKAAIFGVET